MTHGCQEGAAHVAFHIFYVESLGLVQGTMSRFRFSIQTQEDLIQEAFLRFFEHEISHDALDSKSFLLKITRNLAIDCYRKQKRRKMDHHVPLEDVLHELCLPREDEQRCQLHAVQQFLDALKDNPAASTLVQYYDEDLSIKEIAARTQESTATVSSRLSRQRRRYRPQLEEAVLAATSWSIGGAGSG